MNAVFVWTLSDLIGVVIVGGILLMIPVVILYFKILDWKNAFIRWWRRKIK